MSVILGYRRDRFPAEIIMHAVWLFIGLNLSLRDVEEMLRKQDINVSHEPIRRWVANVAPQIA